MSGRIAKTALAPILMSIAVTAHAQALPQPLDPRLPPRAPALAPGGYRPIEDPVPEGVGVADRPRIDYQPVGGRIGSFFLYPTFGVTNLVTDNVRASDANKYGDDAVTLNGGAQIVSGWSRHSLRAGGWYERRFYLSHGEESASQYGGAVAARIDLPDTQVSLRGVAERAVVPRDDFNSPASARSPLRYGRLRGDLNVQHRFNRLGIAGGGSVTRLRYLDVVDDSGAVIDQRFLDFNEYVGKVELTYTVHPGFAVLAQANYTRVTHPLSPSSPLQPGGLDRDSRGWRAEGGVRIALTRLLYGEVRVGYLTRDYDDLRLLKARGLSFGGNLLWNVTKLTSLRVNADRRIEEATSTSAAGNRVTELGGGIEHELRRNILLTGSLRRLRYQPLGPGTGSREWRGAVGARYLVDRRFTVRLDYRYTTRDAPTAARDFTANAVTLGISLSL